MTSFHDTFELNSKGDCDIIDITGQVAELVGKSGIATGIGLAFVAGSTSAISCVEYEPGLVEDLNELYQRIAPKGPVYGHDARWGDGNGHSHVRATLQGPSFTFPVVGGKPVLGTWQQIILLDFDNRSRNRTVHVSVVGD
jgi:secondary thiamine-phosphate synthase enzyme